MLVCNARAGKSNAVKRFHRRAPSHSPANFFFVFRFVGAVDHADDFVAAIVSYLVPTVDLSAQPPQSSATTYATRPPQRTALVQFSRWRMPRGQDAALRRQPASAG